MSLGAVGWRPARPQDSAFVDGLVLADALAGLAAVAEPVRSQLATMQVTARRSAYASAWPNAEDRIVTTDGADGGRLLVDHTVENVHIVDFRVAAAHRDHGVGTTALALLCAEADRRGLRVTLTVEPANPALRLYERAGFVGGPTVSGSVTMTRHGALIT